VRARVYRRRREVSRKVVSFATMLQELAA